MKADEVSRIPCFEESVKIENESSQVFRSIDL